MSLSEEDLKVFCAENVALVFPDICPDYLSGISPAKDYDYEQVIHHILEQLEKGYAYPKRQRLSLKRKRDDEESDDAAGAARRFDNADRRLEPKESEYIKTSKQLLQQAFPMMLTKDLYAAFAEHGNCLYPTVMALDRKLEAAKPGNPPWDFKKKVAKLQSQYAPEALDETIKQTADETVKLALEEFKAVGLVRKAQQDKLDAERHREEEEAANLAIAVAEGTAKDCECCFTECAMNRMIHCEGQTLHVSPTRPFRWAYAG